MRIVTDTSVIIAVLVAEPQKDRLVERTREAELLAPESLHWELGNALAAQMRRGRLDLSDVPRLLEAYQRIPIQLVDVSLGAALEVAGQLKIYAYDAYMVACALAYRCPLITLDQGLVRAAKKIGVEVMEVAG